jgi:hypothetical protein
MDYGQRSLDNKGVCPSRYQQIAENRLLKEDNMEVNAKIHSLNGEMRKAKIIGKTGDNEYLAEYNGVQCTAIFNPLAGCYYVDDKYGKVKSDEMER